MPKPLRHAAVGVDDLLRLLGDLEDGAQRRDGQVERLLVDGGVGLGGAAGGLAVLGASSGAGRLLSAKLSSTV